MPQKNGRVESPKFLGFIHANSSMNSSKQTEQYDSKTTKHLVTQSSVGMRMGSANLESRMREMASFGSPPALSNTHGFRKIKVDMVTPIKKQE